MHANRALIEGDRENCDYENQNIDGVGRLIAQPDAVVNLVADELSPSCATDEARDYFGCGTMRR